MRELKPIDVPLDETAEGKIRQHYLNGESMNDIAIVFNVSVEDVRRIVTDGRQGEL